VRRVKLFQWLLAVLVAFSCSVLSGLAAPPVRIAVTCGGGSGMEQDVVDRISDDLKSNSKVVVSTVNPDWFIVCNIVDRTDTAGASVRVNGTIVIKTTDGQVLNTVSTQTNKQDFSLSPGTPVNKRLQDNAAREVIQTLFERAREPISTAVDTEIQTRDKIIKAQRLGDEDKYDEAIELLSPISPDTPHFRGVRKLIAEFRMERDALFCVRDAQSLAASGKYSQAIETLRAVDPKSKRFGQAKELISKYRAALARRTVRRAPARKPSSPSGDANAAQIKALEAQKKALDAQKKAVEAQEQALKGKGK
jgi:hypothetical protein